MTLSQHWTKELNKQLVRNFTDGDKGVITDLYEKFKKNEKLCKVAMDDEQQIFVNNIFPQLFDNATEEAYVESTETFTSLFENSEKY